ncbi:hypothetical protein, conserved in T. vivax, (fragment), partial [Trypanosoma vivax Y486]
MPKHSTLKSDVRVLHYSQNTHTLTDCPPPPTPPPPLCSPLPCRARFPSLPAAVSRHRCQQQAANSNSNSDNRTAAATRSRSRSRWLRSGSRSRLRSGRSVRQESQRQSGRQPKEGAKHGHTQEVRDEGEQGHQEGAPQPQAHVERVREPLAALHQQPDVDDKPDNEDRELLCERPVRAHCDGGSDNCAREQEAHAGRTRTTDSGAPGAAGRPRQARNGGGHQGGVTRVQLDAMHTYMRYSRDKGPLRAPPLTVSRTRPLDSQRPSVSANHAKAQHVEVRCPRTALLSNTHTLT